MTVWRRLVAIGVLAFATSVAIVGYWNRVSGGGADHQTGDWLISYVGGFVRRGFIGEVIRQAAPGDILVATATVQIGLWLLFVGFVIYRLQRDSWTWSSILLWCGPAAVPFAGWDIDGGFRKEIIAFAALALMSLAADRARWLTAVLVGAAIGVWAVAVLSWEASAVLLPTLLVLCWRALARLPGARALPQASWAWRVVGVGLTAGTAVLVGASVAYPADAALPTICADIQQRGASEAMCGGAIRWLGNGVGDGVAYVWSLWPQHLYFLPMVALAALGVVWAASVGERRWWWAAQLFLIAGLFLIGSDYGRWIHIAAIATAFLAVARRDEDRQPPAVFAVVYLISWGVQHAMLDDDPMPVPYWRGALITMAGLIDDIRLFAIQGLGMV